MKASMNRTAHRFFVLWTFTVLITPLSAHCQESIFSGFKSTSVKADAYFKNGEYQNALDLYLQEEEKNGPLPVIELQIAKTYYNLNNFNKSVVWFKKYLDQKELLSSTEMFKYAEALSSIHRYPEAIKWYTSYLRISPNDEHVKKKIWRLKNIRYLYEDSASYKIKSLAINTPASELGPAIIGNDMVFMSNRKTFGLNTRGNNTDNTPFYKLFNVPIADVRNASVKSRLFCPSLKSKLHEGPVAFYDKGKKMVYSAASEPDEKNGGPAVLKLYFAERTNKRWGRKRPFPYNSNDYSITHPSITEDGTVLFFASDMKGGFGKKDLYKSEYKNGVWSKPVNLGEQINTSEDESFPHIHKNAILYFSSNGQPGLGGIDLYKTVISEDGIGEIQNLGYPLNSSADDFAITLDAEGKQGFFSSNRNHGGLDDDIFEVKFNLQTYPLVLQGILKYKTSDARDADLKILSGASVFIIDNVKKTVVSTTSSDGQGKFNIVIPYFSQYRMRVVDDNGNETIVSLDLAKQRKEENIHEIVIVKETFKSALQNK